MEVKPLTYSKTCLQYHLSLNAGQKYCRMLLGEHSAILSTFIKLPFVIKFFALSIFEWPLNTDFTLNIFQTSVQKVVRFSMSEL